MTHDEGQNPRPEGGEISVEQVPATEFIVPTSTVTSTEEASAVTPPLLERARKHVHVLIERIRTHGVSRKKLLLLAVAVLSVLCLGVVIFTKDSDRLPLWMTYGGSYRLVPEAISQSAIVAIALPEEAGVVNPSQITFTPELKGTFIPSDKERVLYYKPDEMPEIGSHYNVGLVYGETNIGADFMVAEDPRVVSILPNSEAETHEDTKISVIFNRPMVPLTTRDELDKAQVPLRLDPDVPGVWKWKSTRLLQFIPETGLLPATAYTVTVNEGFHSLDGVAVKGFTHTFTTRTLKQISGLPSSLRFNQPLELAFNQPVDLERTAEEITLMQNGAEIEAIIEYARKEVGQNKFLGLVLRGNEDAVDTTRLWIRPLEDRHKREGFWDFTSSYSVSISKKYPLQGSIVDESPVSFVMNIPSVLTSVTAVSERTSYAEPDFFDTQGELVATFYEGIDLKRSTISLKGVRSITYGTQCIPDGDDGWVQDLTTGDCKKEENTREIRITVDPGAYGPDESGVIRFERIVSIDGYELTTEPLTWNIRTVPNLKLYRVLPENGTTSASITSMTVCSNTPLKRPEKISDAVRVDGPVAFPNHAMENSYRVAPGWYGDESFTQVPCEMGQFRTDIRYGLHPERAYAITLTLNDVFGAEEEWVTRFTTEPAPSMYSRFFSLHKWYNVTVPGKTRLTFAVENLPDITAYMCKVSPAVMLEVLRGHTLGTSIPSASLCTDVRTARIDLPDTYWVNNYFYFDIHDYFDDVRGHYILTFTHPNLRDENADGSPQRYEHTLLSVSNLTVGEKTVDWGTYYEESNKGRPSDALTAIRAERTPEDLYWVLQANTLNPIYGATVTAYSGKEYPEHAPMRARGSATTNQEGVARIPSDSNPVGATIALGGDTAIVSRSTDALMYQWQSTPESRTYVYTDRPIYRPGDTVHVRGIDRVGYDHVWSIVDGYDVAFSVSNSRGDTIYEQRIPVSDYGTFNTSFEIPRDAPLGSYSMNVLDSWASFDVEEYVGAPFAVTVTPEEGEYTAGDTAHVSVNARYYFDMPVADAEVEYTVLAQDYYFDRYTDEYFSFGRGWYYCYWCGYGDTFITRGTVTLDGDGTASIAVPLSFAEYFAKPDEEGSKLFTLIARVTDKSGKQVTGQNTVIVHRGAYYLGVKTDPYFSGLNQPVSVRAKSVDTLGAPISRNDITLTVTKVEWESYKRLEVDGGYYWHSEEKRTEIKRMTVDTDRQGSYMGQLTFTEPGSYEITVSSADESGNVIVGQTSMYVWGEGDVSVRETNNETLTVTANKPSYKEGETATILFESPFPQARALVTVERGDIYEYWTMPVSTAFVAKDIPITSEYTPNVFASVLLVGPGPEVKYGNVQITSGRETYELTIDVTASKQAYLPGEEVELTVRTTDTAGTPVQAEISVAVVDMSVLALKGNTKKDPVGFFYGNLSLGVSTAHSAKNMLIEQDIPTGTKGGGGGEELERRKRGVFKDTAYWEAAVRTNEAGEATIRFTLPDNLTTWQVESLGITKDTRVGVDYQEFVSKKKVMAIPVKPRFVIPGDTFSVGMQVANNTDEDITVRTHIESPTLRIIDTDEKSTRVEAGEQTVVYFEVEAPRGLEYGTHQVTFIAQSDMYEDVVEQTIPILKDQMFEVVATAGMTTAPYIFESVFIPDYAVPGEGELTIRAQPTLVASLLDAVEMMAGYPYGCSEQIASRLASLATIRRVGTLFGEEYIGEASRIVFDDDTYELDEAVRAGITELLGRQQYNGGFSFYPGTEPSIYLTVEVVYALTALRDAGYTVADSVFERAAQYTTTELARMRYYDNDMVARVAYALSSPYIPVHLRTPLVARVHDITNNTLTLEQLSTTALGYLAIATYQEPYTRKVADTVFAVLENRIVMDARGAYVTDRLRGYGWFDGPEKNTALFLRAVADRDGEHPALDNMLRWILVSKQRDRGWSSTNATFAVLDSALRIVETRKENTASYMLSLLSDTVEVATHTVNNTTLLETFTHTIPIDFFTRERLHQIALSKTDTSGKGTVYYDMELRYALPPEMVPPRDEGITVERALYARNGTNPIVDAKVGDLVTGTLEITIPEEYRAVSIESFIPAGFELVNFSFATEESRDLAYDTEGKFADDEQWSDEEQWEYDTGSYDMGYAQDAEPGPRPFPVTYEELHDDRVFVFSETVSPGIYTYEYTLRALVPGTYRHMPATVQEMYRPEIFGRTEGGTFTITAR